jgi:hypothetical protein
VISAFDTLQRIIDQTEAEPAQPPTEAQQRSAAASILSKLGASKGGKARAKALSPKKRSQIAKKAAAARWKAHSE